MFKKTQKTQNKADIWTFLLKTEEKNTTSMSMAERASGSGVASVPILYAILCTMHIFQLFVRIMFVVLSLFK